MTTRKFLCLQASNAGQGGATPSAEEMQRMYSAFDSWRQQFANNIVDMGGRLTGPVTVATPDGDIDGASIEAREVFGGYMILAADSLEQAVEIARACPGVVGPNSNVTVREIAS
ncbi:MAG TPA: YciI family protein [Devosia sp.]|jgi:hypothetical protein|nr:YciI family protein [Devosia sp.]